MFNRPRWALERLRIFRVPCRVPLLRRIRVLPFPLKGESGDLPPLIKRVALSKDFIHATLIGVDIFDIEPNYFAFRFKKPRYAWNGSPLIAVN